MLFTGYVQHLKKGQKGDKYDMVSGGEGVGIHLKSNGAIRNKHVPAKTRGIFIFESVLNDMHKL